MPTLRKPFNNSTDWYKSFYNIFYLSQVTSLTLLSYMDSYMQTYSRQYILESKHEELLKRKIISKNYNSETKEMFGFIIHDEEALKSLDLEDFIPQIIEEKIYKNFQQINDITMCAGLQIDDSLNKDITINLIDLLKTTNTKNWYSLIKGFMNIWEFLFLYSSVENTIKQILNIEGNTTTEKLLENLYTKYPNFNQSLIDNGYLTSKGNFNLWTLYTELRHIYSHTHGILTKKGKGNLCSKIHNLKKSLEEIDIMNGAFIDIDNIFKKSTLQINKFYLLKDEELNIFRNFIIILIENLDDLTMES
jgi:aspartate carbamoyltransferase regulatory subunit